MVAQSHAQPIPILLLRPKAQGADFADDLIVQFGSQLTLIESPLLAPRFFSPQMPAGPFAALILTSKTGVSAYLNLGAAVRDLPKSVYCVGESTAIAASLAGLFPICAAPNAKALIQDIAGCALQGRLLHLRGRDARGDVARNLQNAGIDTESVIVYAQEMHPLTIEAQTVLQQTSPVLVPLFSPRTAQIFAAEMGRISGISPLFVAAMSGDVALEARGLTAQVKVAHRPDAAAMRDALALLLVDVRRA